MNTSKIMNVRRPCCKMLYSGHPDVVLTKAVKIFLLNNFPLLSSEFIENGQTRLFL